MGRVALLLGKGSRSSGVGLRAGQRGVGHGAVGHHDPEHPTGRQRCRRTADASRCRRAVRQRQAAQRSDRRSCRGNGDRRRAAAAIQRLQSANDAEPGEASDPRSGGMDYFLTWGHSPSGQQILTHVSWNLLWASLFAGVVFLVAHASYMVLSAHRKRHPEETDAMEAARPDLPSRIPRHSGAARAFHWVMAASMFTLLLTAFLPIAGVKFAWVQWHWMAGLLLTTSILFHVIHASVWLDFWSIWVGPKDLPELRAEILREFGHDVPGPKPGKYPLGNRLYHLALVVVGLSVIASGLTMMVRVRTPLFPRNPYLLSDSTWGFVYVTHGMAGVALVGLVIAHVYFAVRPDKWWITKAMIVGWITRRQYLEHHDPDRWAVADP